MIRDFFLTYPLIKLKEINSVYQFENILFINPTNLLPINAFLKGQIRNIILYITCESFIIKTLKKKFKNR